MASAERLVYPTRCRLCGAEIEAGTPLESLSWDPERRAWGHRSPRCEDFPNGGTRKAQPTVVSSEALHSTSPPTEASAGPQPPESPPDPPTSGAWSVTLELHEAADPALSKRVVRIARLHLRTLDEVHRVVGQLREVA
jgi:hypothetical protein